jgi:hypothetical protein
VDWEIEYTDQFERWWNDLTEEQQEALDDRIVLLAEAGPRLKRPIVGDIYDIHLDELHTDDDHERTT